MFANNETFNPRPHLFHLLHFFKALSAFKIAIIETPTSANTACHMLETPIPVRISTKILTKIANAIFSLTIRIVFLAILILSTIFDGSSVIKTTSAASIAASCPKRSHCKTNI